MAMSFCLFCRASAVGPGLARHPKLKKVFSLVSDQFDLLCVAATGKARVAICGQIKLDFYYSLTSDTDQSVLTLSGDTFTGEELPP